MNKRFLFFIPTVIISLFTVSLAAITGRVVDQSGSPVELAQITYTDISNRLLWATSDADGNFSLEAPGSVSAMPKLNGTVLDRKIDPVVSGSILNFNSLGSKTRLAIYSLSGQKIAQRQFPDLESGRYSLNPFASLTPKAAAMVYLVRITTAKHTSTVKMMNMVKGSDKPGIRSGGKSRGNEILANLTKTGKISQVDRIRVGRTEYTAAYVDLSSYDMDVGDVTITQWDIEQRLDSLMALMSREEIIGQMIQTDMRDVTLQQASDNYMGTIFGAGGAAPPDGNNPSNWADWCDNFQSHMLENTPNGIPFLISMDNVHGNNGCVGGTVIPHNIGLGATFDPDLVKKVMRMTGIEIRGIGMNWTLAPCIAVPRHLHWGRTYEGFGETPELGEMMAYASIIGLQGTDNSNPYSAAGTAKHWAGDGGTDGGVNTGNCTGDDAVLRSIHVAPYYNAVEAGILSIMPSFSSWNGVPMHNNKPMTTTLLKEQMGFDGFVNGDYWAHYGDGWGPREAILAGLDEPMTTNEPWKRQDEFGAVYDENSTGEARVRDACRRVLRAKFRMGLFDDFQLTNRDLTSTVGSQLHRDAAREAVRKSLVLLKNENNVLPLNAGAKVHILGTGGDDIGLQCGGWTISWQGSAGDITEGTTIYEGFNNVGSGEVTQSNSGGIPGDADVVVVVVSEKPYAEGDGDNGSLDIATSNTMYENGTNLINEAAASGKPVVCILLSGRPMIVTNEIEECDAFVAAWWPGTEGDGIAEVLYGGEYDFTGRLPHTWPRSYSQEPINYGNMGDASSGATDPLFEYGYGLSYQGELPRVTH